MPDTNNARVQFVETTEETFSRACSNYLEAMVVLIESDRIQESDLLAGIMEAAICIQNQMANMLCPYPGTNTQEVYWSMRARAEGLLLCMEHLEETVTKPCIDCRHYLDVSGKAHCLSHRNKTIDRVYGTERQIAQHCETLREPDDGRYCGEQGRWFEQKVQEKITLN